jgi:hypothetical protein
LGKTVKNTHFKVQKLTEKIKQMEAFILGKLKEEQASFWPTGFIQVGKEFTRQYWSQSQGQQKLCCQVW